MKNRTRVSCGQSWAVEDQTHHVPGLAGMGLAWNIWLGFAV